MERDKEPTYEELEAMRDGYCDACKGSPFSSCSERCEGFREELEVMRREQEDWDRLHIPTKKCIDNYDSNVVP